MIKDLMKQEKPFLVRFDAHEICVYPQDLLYDCFDCKPGFMTPFNQNFVNDCVLLDWFEDSSDSSCTCLIPSLMGNGCTCGAIVRYSK